MSQFSSLAGLGLLGGLDPASSAVAQAGAPTPLGQGRVPDQMRPNPIAQGLGVRDAQPMTMAMNGSMIPAPGYNPSQGLTPVPAGLGEQMANVNQLARQLGAPNGIGTGSVSMVDAMPMAMKMYNDLSSAGIAQQNANTNAQRAAWEMSPERNREVLARGYLTPGSGALPSQSQWASSILGGPGSLPPTPQPTGAGGNTGPQLPGMPPSPETAEKALSEINAVSPKAQDALVNATSAQQMLTVLRSQLGEDNFVKLFPQIQTLVNSRLADPNATQRAYRPGGPLGLGKFFAPMGLDVPLSEAIDSTFGNATPATAMGPLVRRLTAPAPSPQPASPSVQPRPWYRAMLPPGF